MWAIYKICANYGVAIILFTLITKALLFPLSIKQQKSTARMSSFQPKIAALQKKYGNNKEKLQEEQMKLYADEGINPMGSCLPLLIQFPILFGIIDVVYRPMTHIMHLSKDIIAEAAVIAKDILTTISTSTTAAADQIASAVNALKNFDVSMQQQLFIMQAYEYEPSKFAGIEDFAANVGNFDMTFLGLNLGTNPTWAFPLVLIPILAGLSQLALTIYMQIHQKKTNPGMPSMGAMNMMMYVMPVMSAWFAFSLPAGVGFYWIMQSVFSFVQTIILNRIYTPAYVATLVEKDVSKKKKKGPTFIQKAMEQQRALQAEGKEIPTKVVPRITDDGKKSKSSQKEYNSKVIADARRRQAEKYGDVYDEDE